MYITHLRRTFHTSALFLLMVFFNHVARSIKAFKNTSLGSSTEFLVIQTYSIVSLCLYPLLQIIFRFYITVNTYTDTGKAVNRGPLLSSVLPQVVNHIEKLVILVLCIRANMKMKVLADPSKKPFCYRFAFYRKMNWLLVFFLLLDIGGLSAINVDVLLMIFAGGPGSIYTNTFNTDWCTSMFSLGCLGTHLVVLFMLFPPVDFEAMADASDEAAYMPVMPGTGSAATTQSVGTSAGNLTTTTAGGTSPSRSSSNKVAPAPA